MYILSMLNNTCSTKIAPGGPPGAPGGGTHLAFGSLCGPRTTAPARTTARTPNYYPGIHTLAIPSALNPV